MVIHTCWVHSFLFISSVFYFIEINVNCILGCKDHLEIVHQFRCTCILVGNIKLYFIHG